MLSKLSLVINALLIVAVGYLFLRKPVQAPLVDSSTGAEVKIAEAFSGQEGARPVVLAYINGDTINNNYAFIKEKQGQLETKLKNADSKYLKEYETRQRKADELMRYAQEHPNLSPSEQAAIQNEVMQMEQEMAKIEKDEFGAVQKQRDAMDKELHSRVQKFLVKYAKEKGIDYVVNYQEGLKYILYGSPAYDITSEVLAGLNAEYALEKEIKK